MHQTSRDGRRLGPTWLLVAAALIALTALAILVVTSFSWSDSPSEQSSPDTTFPPALEVDPETVFENEDAPEVPIDLPPFEVDTADSERLWEATEIQEASMEEVALFAELVCSAVDAVPSEAYDPEVPGSGNPDAYLGVVSEAMRREAESGERFLGAAWAVIIDAPRAEAEAAIETACPERIPEQTPAPQASVDEDAVAAAYLAITGTEIEPAQHQDAQRLGSELCAQLEAENVLPAETEQTAALALAGASAACMDQLQSTGIASVRDELESK